MSTWLAAEPAAGGGTDMIQIIMAIAAIVGALGGLAAVLTVWIQRRKLKADAADVLTDTALTLIDPLKGRVRELETEVKTARDNVAELSEAVEWLTTTMRRWRAAILSPTVSREELRQMVKVEQGPGRNGTGVE